MGKLQAIVVASWCARCISSPMVLWSCCVHLDLGTSTVTTLSPGHGVCCSRVPFCLAVHSSLTSRRNIWPTIRSTFSMSRALVSLICFMLALLANSVT